MAKLLIPTRNRPTGLGGVLKFLHKNYPATQVIVADGSAEEIKPQNAAAVAAVSPGLAVEYLPYPYEMPFFDRLLDVLRAQSEPFIIMGSDDDFPMMDMLGKGETFLRANPDYVTAMGTTIHLMLRAPDEMVARLAVVRHIAAENAEARARAYSAWAFSTTYAVTRREHLIARYERAASRFVPGFYDYATGLHDVMAGKIRAFPEIGFFGTRNYRHSYLRPEESLIFLRRSEEVLTLLGTLKQDLTDVCGLTDEAAKTTSELLLTRRIAELCGAQAHRRVGFMETPMFLNPTVQSQIKMFSELFAEGTAARRRYLPRMTDLVAALRANAESEDNSGEKRFYESLDAQAGNEGGSDASRGWKPVARTARPKPGDEGNDELVQLRLVDPVSILEMFDDDTSEPPPEPAAAGRPILPAVAGQLAPHLLVLGQSNVASHGKPRGASDFGACTHGDSLFPLADPIPGGTGAQGSVWTRFAPLARDRLGWDDLTLTVLAKGGSTVAEWAEPGGRGYEALSASLPALQAMARPVTHVIYHQGESDGMRGTGKADYMARFRALHARVSQALPGAVWILCRASYRMGETSPEIIAAQTELAQSLPGCHAGPDTDAFDRGYRHDDTHFAARGFDAFAEALVGCFAALGVTAK